eukprot:m.31438 g.31438  ORF g.31438 m.31438 type:complete len:75 (+) comp12070_c0_seq2:139-363(+)
MYTPTIHLQDLDAMQASSLILQIDASKIYLSSCHLRRAGLVAELKTTETPVWLILGSSNPSKNWHNDRRIPEGL